MELRHLRYFLEVARAGNFTRAADSLHLSQPSLSVQIRALEDELGMKVFDRLGRSVLLTQAGALFKEHAERALREIEHGVQLVSDLHGARRGRLVVGTLATVNSYLIPPLVSHFKQRFPAIHLQVHSQPSADIVEGLIANRLDLGICLLPVSQAQLATIPLFDERLVLVGPPQHKVKPSRMRMREMAGLPLVLMPADYCLRRMIEGECGKARITTQVVLEMTSPEGILEAVAEGAGFTILPELYVRHRSSHKALRVIDLYDPIPSHAVGLVHRVRRHQHLAAREFGLLCRSTMNSLLAVRSSRAARDRVGDPSGR
ncbi:Transcriptional activator protein, LysR family [Nitrospira sp. KM1]|uniref:LysR substrate-binding domain-containing protein n=1 Tax=Nitrospira sp. KM1 TaxID=1936990 RepID=UPI0013A78A6F|nr:LysR substrate-binding domain-containing protein [Nitrospira sp. KM1]BCA55574.1 Transcriptional activator protein, LysR family [Nitrospira sp. KM1]